MPFGEEIDADDTWQRTAGLNYAVDEIEQKFTSYERDNETELDFAQARMFGSGFGRFTSPDPFNIIFVKRSGGRKAFVNFILQPQNWNKYIYVLNRPLTLIDPTGLSACDPKTNPNCKTDQPLIPKECVGCTWGTDKEGKPIILNQDGTRWLPVLPTETVNVTATDGPNVPLGGGNSRPSWYKRWFPWLFAGGAAAVVGGTTGTGATSATIVAANAGIITGLGITNGMVVTEDKVLDLADQFLGTGYTEDPNTSGRFISADGTRVVRMTGGDLTGHGGRDNPHFNFETLKPNPKKPGKMKRDRNLHVYFDCSCNHP